MQNLKRSHQEKKVLNFGHHQIRGGGVSGADKHISEVRFGRVPGWKGLALFFQKRVFSGTLNAYFLRLSLQSGRIGMPIPSGMEWPFHSNWNGMRSFHSVWNGMVIPFRPEWRAHSILAGME